MISNQNINAISTRSETIGRARLLPSWRRNGSAGASPSRIISILICVFALTANALAVQDKPTGENSTDKARVKPDELSKKAGSAILWERKYADALAKSKETGKPIFWYVPSIPGTFTDRKVEIDRYMLAGPFSWPAIIKLINENCIPLKALPNKALSEQFTLKVYDFVEPGFLIIQPDERVKLSANRMTTLHPLWLFQTIASALGNRSTWAEYSGSKLDLTASFKNPPSDSDIASMASSDSMEAKLVAGMLVFRTGRHAQAQRIWLEASRAHPNDPLAWKASCEAQGYGPFCRGFEVFSELSDSAYKIPDVMNITSAALPTAFTEAELWERSVDYLLGMQREDGGFFDSDYDFGGADSLPNVYTAITSLVGLALLEAEHKSTDLDKNKEIRAAIERITAYVSDDANVNLNDRDEILWAQAYRVRFLAAVQKKAGNDSILSNLQRSVKQLENLQLSTGGWYHEYANSFVSATALTALFDASLVGATVDSSKVNSGLKRLATQRFANGAYPYAVRPENGKDAGTANELAGGGGRISICELARRRWGQVNDADYEAAVTKSLGFHDLLAKALKYDNHTSTYAYGGFFFWYDMQARSEAIGLVSDEGARKKLAAKQRELILNLPEIDGCFVDSHELGRCYGTAMGLLSLSLLK
ncbi:MAG: terpene cyclase/mutase family protein [Planctomycetota bacterium]|nr:terpene cyclase/mutase family protein [Planctomycetota bacterium]